MHDPLARPSPKPFAMGFREFVPFVAALMMINALGIDSMLPALPAIGASLHLTGENERQWVIAAYVFGFGAAQLLYGPLADRYGRKPVLLVSMVLFAITSVACALAWSFASLIAARALEGIAAAASRVLAVSIVRDRYSGRLMARVMSLCFIVFLAVPILAPSIGQLIMLIAPWRGIFLFLAGFGAMLAGWGMLRLPETLHPEDRRAIDVAALLGSARLVLGNRQSLGYTLASTCMFGTLLGFINSVQQIFADIFHMPRTFPIAFAAMAGCMGVAAYANSRIVERVGTRRISHSALLAFVAVALVHLGVALAGLETLWTFAVLQAMTMSAIALSGSNFGSMAMEPVGHIAGTASAMQGFVSTVGGAGIGILIGQSFNGTTAPVAGGCLLFGCLALAIVLVTERGRLFRAQHAPPIAPDRLARRGPAA